MNEQNNMMNNGGYYNNMMPGYPQPGYQYNNRPQAKMTQTLTPEQIKSLKGTGSGFDLRVSQPEMWRAICTHKENNNIVLVQQDDGSVKCPICGEEFNLSYLDRAQVEEAVKIILDVLQSAKTFYLDIPEEMASQYFQIIPLLKKLPQLYDISKNNFNQYDASNPANPAASPFGFNALNAFTSPAFAMQQPGYYQQPMPQPGYYYPQQNQQMMQPNYYQQPMAQPPMGANPFGYNEQAAAPQAQSQQPAQQTPAAQAQSQQPAQQTPAEVNQQKVFNV